MPSASSPAAAVGSGPAPDRTAGRARDLAWLALLTAVLRIPALFAPAHLTFDDGVFGASAVAMRNGGVPFRDVFSSQGPAFLPLVWLADLAGLRALNGPRLLGLVSALVLVGAVYLAGREISDTTSARVAAVLAAVTGSSLAVTGGVAADGPAMALATVALLLALRYRRDPSMGHAVAVGVVLGLAIMVKALVLPAAIPIGLVLLWGRRPAHMAAAVGSAVAVGLILSLSFGFADVWDQSVVYHLDAPGGSSPVDNLVKILNTLVTRDLLLLAGLVAGLGAVWWRRRRGEDPVTGDDRADTTTPTAGPPIGLLLGTWFGAMFVLLVMEHPLWRPHVSELVAPAALLVAWFRPDWRVVAGLGLLLVPLHLAFAQDFLWPDDYEGDEAVVVDALRDLPAGAEAISDEPGQVWRAGRRTPDDLVDTSMLRTESGRITTDSLVEEAARSEVCAVVVWSSRFGDLPDLEPRLAAAGYEVAERFDDTRVLYTRVDCVPS